MEFSGDRLLNEARKFWLTVGSIITQTAMPMAANRPCSRFQMMNSATNSPKLAHGDHLCLVVDLGSGRVEARAGACCAGGIMGVGACSCGVCSSGVRLSICAPAFLFLFLVLDFFDCGDCV